MRGAAPATCRKLRGRVRALQHFVGAPLAELAPAHLSAYLAALQLRVLPRTASDTLARLRPFLRWASRSGYLLLDPARELELPPVTRTLIPALTEGQVLSLLRTCDARTAPGLRDLAVLETLYGTGLRHTEAWGLALADLDLAERTLRVRQGKSGPRLAPLGDHLAELLADYVQRARAELARPQTPALWVADSGRGLGRHGLQRVVRQAGERAGLPRLSAHALRRAFATHLLRHGARVEEVQALLGHRCLKATECYTSLVSSDVAQDYQRTHPRSRRRDA